MAEVTKLPLQRIEARFAANRANREERTVPVVLYTGAKVVQFNFSKGLHHLQMSMEPSSIQLGRLETGRAPFKLGHSDPGDPSKVLGVMTNPRLEAGNLVADVRFSKRPDVEPFYQDVLDGVLTNASIEAALLKLKETTKEGEAMRSFMATLWEPSAAALVAEGADPGAHIAAASLGEHECEVEVIAEAVRADRPKEAQTMPETTNAGTEARTETTQAVTPSADEQLNAAREVGVTAEQGRITGIIEVARVCNLGMAFAEKHIKANTSLADFRTVAIDAQAKAAAQQEVRHVHADILSDEADKRRINMSGALLERFAPGKWSLANGVWQHHRDGGQRFHEGARNYASCTLLDIAKECLAVRNIRWQMRSRTEIAQLAFQSTSDFPYILEDVANKSLRAGYEMYESQWRMVAARRSAADFKTVKELTLDSSSRLEKVPESGEFKRGKLVEGKESWQLSTYGKIIAITRQAVINDDLGAFTRTPQLLGQEVAMLEADTVWGIVTANGALADGGNLFNATAVTTAGGHANLVTSSGTAISIDSIGSMRVKMMLQKSPGGKAASIQPRYLVASATKSQLAEQYTSSAYVAATAATINNMAGRLTPIIEPRLDASGAPNAWYLFADPASPNGTVLIYAYLEGQEGPYTESRNGFDVDGVELKIRHDFGAAAIDFRGAVKNDGA